MLLKPRKRKSLVKKVRVGCPFCSKQIAQPQPVPGDLLSDATGGRCACGAFWVLDEVGRFGGQALMDVTAMACDGDVEAAMKLEQGVHYEIRTMPLRERSPRRGLPAGPAFAPSTSGAGRGRQAANPEPKVWFLLLKEQ